MPFIGDVAGLYPETRAARAGIERKEHDQRFRLNRWSELFC